MKHSSALKPGDSYAGFHVLSVRSVPEYRSVGIHLKHTATGCRVYHLFNEDEENLFSFGFKTPPPDNTGITHIIEHSVLSGSERFPVKDPFIELIKGSMKTFLNAMTYPDKTIYPASSINRKDLFNMMLVDGDAVFFPLLRKEIFLQEGHRLVLGENDNPFITGVVYNEMRGNYSSHESIVGEWSYRSLFTNSPYRFDSGGDPDQIPELTYEQFLDYHRTYYHPSNCYLFLYGNIDTETYLDFLDRHFLASFTAREVEASIPPEKRWQKPITLVKGYPVAEDGSSENKTTISINWLCNDITDTVTALGMEILSEALLGNPGSPLHKKIIDSGIGEDLSPVSGYDENIKESVFSVGVRGSNPDQSGAFTDLVLGELRDLVSQGIPEDALEGAIYRTEFRNREIPAGIPLGLRLMGRAYRGWIHTGDPESTLLFDDSMKIIKEKFKESPSFFAALLDSLIIRNQHRSTVIIKPDPSCTKKRAGRRTELIERKINSNPEENQKKIARENKLLDIFQKTPDSTEDLEKIPSLHIDDLPRTVRTIDTTTETVSDVPVYIHPMFTNDVLYFDFGFEIGPLNREDLSALPLLGKSVYSTGVPGLGYDKTARELSTCTGGFGFTLEASTHLVKAPDYRRFYFFRVRTLKDNLSKAMNLVFRFFTEPELENTSRIKELVREMRNDMHAALLPRGHAYATLRAGAALSPVVETEEQWRGISQLLFLSSLGKKSDAEFDSITETLVPLHRRLFRKERLFINCTCPETMRSPAIKELETFINDFPGTGKRKTRMLSPQISSAEGPLKEGLLFPSSVGYAGFALHGVSINREEYAYDSVLSHLLSTGFLWQNIRMTGGAYGASCSPNATEGLFNFSSYRDPDVGTSLQVFREALEYAAAGEIGDEELRRAIIGTVGKESRPSTPRNEGFIGFRRNLYGIDDWMRQKKRDAELALTRAHIRQSARRLLKRFDQGSTAVLAGDTLLEKTEKITGPFTTITSCS